MITLLSAPSNLGLRPPVKGSIPGAAKAPEAFREAGLFEQFIGAGAKDGGVVLPGRYVDDDDARPAGHVRNEAALIDHARRLARRISFSLAEGDTPIVIGGDCSILLGAGLALSRRGTTGLIHVDGHTDFRHPGNSDECASVAGEDLAAAIGLHWPAIADIDGQGPYFSSARTVHIGHRQADEYALETRQKLGLVLSAGEAITGGLDAVTVSAQSIAGRGYWLQLDVDVLDPSVMPAVDSPDPGGFTTTYLTELLTHLAPEAVGASVTVFDPDLDPTGTYARSLTEVIVQGLHRLGSAP